MNKNILVILIVAVAATVAMVFTIQKTSSTISYLDSLNFEIAAVGNVLGATTDGLVGYWDGPTKVANFDKITSYPFTISAWTTAKTGNNALFRSVVSLVHRSHQYFGIGWAGTTGIPALAASNPTFSATRASVVGKDIKVNIVGVFDSPTERRIYVNGVLDARDESEINIPFIPNKIELIIGPGGAGGSPSYTEVGEVRIYNRSLSESEIGEIYKSGLSDLPDVVAPTTPSVSDNSVSTPDPTPSSDPTPASSATRVYPSIIPEFDPRLDVVVAPTGFGTGKVWQVGPSRQYKKPSEVVNLVKDGDVVEIDAATYKCDDSVKWKTNFLTLRGVGGRPVLDSTGCKISGGKGIWTPDKMQNMIVDNIEFMGAKVADSNGAGIRYQGGGYLYITNSYFHDNENGILTGSNSPVDIVVDHSEFARNGAPDGKSHNMYISNIANSFVLRFSYSHDSRVGHTFKSRAVNNYVLYNRLADEASGNSSYNIDVPQGGLTYIIGNIIQQSSKSPNYGIIAYSFEKNPHPIQKLYISYNTIVSEGLPAASVLKFTDNGLTEAIMTNNLIFGVSPSNVVPTAPEKVTMVNNIVTDSPNFYDRSNRIYYLTATSPAVNKGTDPGNGSGLSLLPKFQFVLGEGGQERIVVGPARDVGAYEYDSKEEITPAPTVTFSAEDTTINHNTPAKLYWSSTDTTKCEASGAWSGRQPTSGSFTSSALTSNKTFNLVCSGTGGSSAKSISITVNDSSAAAELGVYRWQEISGSALNSVSAANLKDSSGNNIYADNFGTGSSIQSTGTYATGVYVPETGLWYLMGGGSGRNYYGNEVYAFNFNTMKAERVTEPAHISETVEYYPSDLYGSKVHLTGCNGILHLNSGGLVPALRGIAGAAAYDPLSKKIIVGPSGSVAGIGNCNGSALGQMATDMWSFDPIAKSWSLIAPEDDRFGSVNPATWFFDPVTSIAYNAGNRSGTTRGGYLIDYKTVPPKAALVDNVPPFQVSTGPIAVDTKNHYALQLKVDNSKIAVFNLNGLSLDNYGTNGSPGSTGTKGSSKPLFEPDLSWTFSGDTTVLSMPDVAIVYNPKINKFVAWAGGDTIYFLTPNYQTKVLDILSKRVTGNPTSTVGVANKFTYIPDRDIYLAFAGTNNNFFLLIPPTGALPTSTPIPVPAPLPTPMPPVVSNYLKKQAVVFSIDQGFSNGLVALGDTVALERMIVNLKQLQSKYEVYVSLEPKFRDKTKIDKILDVLKQNNIPFVFDVYASDNMSVGNDEINLAFDVPHGRALPIEQINAYKTKYGSLFAGLRAHEVFGSNYTVLACQKLNVDWCDSFKNNLPNDNFYQKAFLEEYIKFANEKGMFFMFQDFYWSSYHPWEFDKNIVKQDQNEQELKDLINKYPNTVVVMFANNEPAYLSRTKKDTWMDALKSVNVPAARGFGLSNQSWMCESELSPEGGKFYGVPSDKLCPPSEIAAWATSAFAKGAKIVQFEPSWYLWNLPKGTIGGLVDFTKDPAWRNRGEALSTLKEIGASLGVNITTPAPLPVPIPVPIPPPAPVPPITPQKFPGDFNDDNKIDVNDFGLMRVKWGRSDNLLDLNKDGIVNSLDYSLLLKDWGK